MRDEASMTMMVCAGLEPDEEAKLERLDGRIWETIRQAGHEVRICQARWKGEDRYFDFCGAKGVACSVLADKFMAAGDDNAVKLVAKAFV